MSECKGYDQVTVKFFFIHELTINYLLKLRREIWLCVVLGIHLSCTLMCGEAFYLFQSTLSVQGFSGYTISYAKGRSEYSLHIETVFFDVASPRLDRMVRFF